jgi:membrane-associated phospholipid phosphatase
MQFLTDFGDSAVLMPVCATIFIWLSARRHSFGSALWWAASIVLCTGAMALLKMFFFACPADGGLESPSGHTAFSLLTYGGIAVIVGGELGATWMRIALLVVAVLFAAAIAESRVVLQMHSPIETVVGFAVGGVSLALFGFGYRRTRSSARSIALFVGAIAIVTLICHGTEFSPEDYLHRVSEWLNMRSVCA